MSLLAADTLGDRMKAYESVTDYVLPDQLPVIVRFDGRAFSSLTRKLKLARPMDEFFHQAMVKTTTLLCEEVTNARIGYTCSDEISILVYPKYVTSQPFFGNRLCKILSVLSGIASVTLYKELLAGPHAERLRDSSIVPSFDARAFVMPVHDTPNAFLWRLRDAAKNSVSAFAEAHFSSRELENVNTTDRMGMLLAKGVDWNLQESWKKYGTAVVRKVSEITGMFGPPGKETERTVLRHEWDRIEASPDGDHSIVNIIKMFLTEPEVK
jgi:tRNA(His) 5'-end guanylyltransferase